MGLRYLGNINKPGYNPLASNITTGVNVVQYQGIFTTQQQLQAITTGQWVTDPVFDYSTLLLQADSIANGSQNNTFLDSSTNNFTITRNGNTTQGTFSPFSSQPGAWANYFDGTGDYLTGTITAVNNTTMTMECWVWLNSLDNVDGDHFLQVDNGANTNYTIAHNGNGAARFLSRNNTGGAIFDLISANSILQTNKWHHIVGVRNASAASLYVDGTRVATVSSPTVSSTDGTSLSIAYNNSSSPREPNGYISNARIVSGTAVYDPTSSSLTVPTSPLTAVSGTRILTCQSNRFVDNSGNNVALTVNGTPSVQAFSPFAPQFQYTASGTGGSGYFDGTGDYLTLADSTAWDLTGDYTLEMWIYPLATTGGIFGIGDYRATFNGMDFYFNANKIELYVNGAAVLTGATTIVRNQWYHLALVRSGSSTNNTKLYINGFQDAQGTNTTSFTGVAGNGASIGNDYGGSYGAASVNGYISSLRLLKGTALYTTTFTPPTAPLTAITNTSLLTNFTNAGILDGTMKNNLETVGNASVSTSVVKYGSGSLYFDGNGDALLIRPDAPLPLFVRTADFTVEAWIYLSSTSVANYMLWGNNGPDIQFYVNTSAKLVLAIGAVGGPTGSINIPTNTWVHVAATRTAGYINLFVNGVFDTRSTTGGTSNLNNSKYYVGTDLTSYFNGYIDDMRFTLGVARYITSFTPPSVALPRQ